MTTPGALPAFSLNIGKLYGSIFGATFVSASLWGISCMQAFIYYINYPQDPAWQKLMVAWIWVLDTFHQVLVLVGLYGTVITNFGNVENLTLVPLTTTWAILPSVLGACTAQSYFTYRLWNFSRRNILFPIVLIPVITCQLAATIVYMSLGIRNPTAAELHKTGHIALGFNSVAAATDVGIAFCMVYLLLRERSSFMKSNRMIFMLIIFTINTGLWSAAVALAVVITLVARPSPDLTFGALYFVLGSVYCNTVLANLNSRAFVSRTGRSQPSSDVPLESVSQNSRREGILDGKAFRVHAMTTVHTDISHDPTLENAIDIGRKSMDQSIDQKESVAV